VSYSKDDVEFHSDGFNRSKPAVNVKVYSGLLSVKLPICLGGVSEIGSDEIQWQYTDPEFTVDWIEENVEGLDEFFAFACERGWEELQDIAEQIWYSGVKVWQQGRSGGWAVVDGLNHFDHWDAIDLAKWRSFERKAKAIAAGIPEAMMTDIYINEFETRED
jgi:hypothetical protein